MLLEVRRNGHLQTMIRQLMIVPSLACPAGCSYCFGPHDGGPTMRLETIDAIVRWQSAFDGADKLDVTFHGGEPLVAGAAFYRAALRRLRRDLASRRVRFSLQSNLWLLDDELCEIFQEHGVSIGTSLDGPERVKDPQRGQGYFRRTMAGIERARRRGLSVGCICTFTSRTAPYAEEVFDFFAREGLGFTIHAALPSLRYGQIGDWALTPEAHGELLVGMLDRYLPNLSKIRIGSLDSLCRSVSAGQGGICTFGDCLGRYLAVGPDGEIYPCQRFAGMSEYELGDVHDCPSQEALGTAPVWRTFEERQRRIAEECGDCPSLGFCRGGCPYNTLAANGGSFDFTLRDPHCAAYRRVFTHITDRALEEVFSEENMKAVVAEIDNEAGMLRRGRLVTLMRGGPHPYETAQHARQTLMVVALAAANSAEEAARKLQSAGVVSNRQLDEAALRSLHWRLTEPATGLNNLYLHVTFACPLCCTHCYARAGTERKGTLAVADIARVCREAVELGFRHAVITGGEPLVHPQRDALLDTLAGLRREVKPLLTVMRTSLALHVDNDVLHQIGYGTDEVVVSVDGDRATHDARRGTGSYDLTVANLRTLMVLDHSAEVSLATVLPAHLAADGPGQAVRTLAKELGIRRTRFRPLLRLGRAADAQFDLTPESLRAHMPVHDQLALGFGPVASCGIGQNLYVEPDGSAYPCYAWHGEDWLLGNLNGMGGLSKIVTSDSFRDLGRHTVNSNQQCCHCPLRYLCGGACRAWNRPAEQDQPDLDAAPTDCSSLHARARTLLIAALEHVGVTVERWIDAGLPLPEMPPIVKERRVGQDVATVKAEEGG
ncbi:MAG: TIGR04083 family peptide-modifying radical SAM enzyme [Chloroflexota bacterium]|nr:MAG: TIGR04083 family peptide-modifying radical SAM enzyme [Chloroflexota bacterium]